MPEPKAAIIIPTYNEKSNIGLLIAAVFKILPKVLVVVVDDSSPDQTAQEVKRLQKRYKNLRLIVNKNKAGRGQAVWLGFKDVFTHTQTQIFVEMDADFSHRPQELSALIKKVKAKTAVFASRYLPESVIPDWPLSRRIFSFLANKTIGLVLSLPLKDNTNGYRAYSRSAIRIILEKPLICKSYLLLSEVALILHHENFILKETPSVFPNRKRGKSNTNWHEILHNLIELTKLKFFYQDKFFNHE